MSTISIKDYLLMLQALAVSAENNDEEKKNKKMEDGDTE